MFFPVRRVSDRILISSRCFVDYCLPVGNKTKSHCCRKNDNNELARFLSNYRHRDSGIESSPIYPKRGSFSNGSNNTNSIGHSNGINIDPSLSQQSHMSNTWLAQYGVRIVFEDNHIVVIDKPCGIKSQPGSSSSSSSVSVANVYDIMKEYYRLQRNKPSVDNVYLALIHRLDRETSGLMILAKTSKAATRLSESLRSKSNTSSSSSVDHRHKDGEVSSSFEKVYLAIVHGHVEKKQDTLKHNLEVVTDNAVKHQFASLSYQALKYGFAVSSTHNKDSHSNKCTWLKVCIHTGRKHQIRAQLSHIGHPILGDSKYGSKYSVNDTSGSNSSSIALHACELRFEHPVLLTNLDTSLSNSKSVSKSESSFDIKDTIHKVVESKGSRFRRIMEIKSDPSEVWHARYDPQT